MGEPEVVAHLGRYLDANFATFGLPGVSIGLTDRERSLGVVTHGLADLAARTRVAPEHLFEIGSISKSFTAIALLQEHEAGRIDLHAPVTEYLPWFEVRTRFGAITPHHLLTHTAGIVIGEDSTGEGTHEVWLLRETETGFPPGERHWYSNTGYKVLGLMLERLAGQPCQEVVRERVIEPIGMHATDPVITHETRKRLAVGYEPFYDDRPRHSSHALVTAPWWEYSTGDGSIASTAEDMTAYARMLLNRGAHPGGRVLSEESFDLLVRPVIEDEPGSFYGYGMRTWEVEGHRRIGHTGGMIGYHAVLTTCADDGIGVITLANGPAYPEAVAEFAVLTLCAWRRAESLPAIPHARAPEFIENAPEYAGRYRSDRRTIEVIAESSRLMMRHDGDRVTLERRAPDAFVVPDPEFELFHLWFSRDERGGVIEAVHGGDRYVNDRYSGRRPRDDLPAGWTGFPGHYRSYNPWGGSSFRIFPRDGRLFMQIPVYDEPERPLTPLPDGSFRVGEDWSPDRIRFDTVIEGLATRAIYDAAASYRTFTP